MKTWLKHGARLTVLVLVLSVPFLIGAKSEDIIGCGCPQGAPKEEATGGDIPGGGAIAASQSYSLERAEVGASTQAVSSTGYQVSGTVGHYLSQGRTLSETYLIHHPLSRNVITDSAALAVEDPEAPLE